ncbi:hypothetical protein AAFF_G00078760 [Aldrovandia affinis]|uniref:Uncharacterized protein n=1 Tax=Aldrovandia affinis TaxID=143900 RepID=A0AAD7WD09_9TELE|nr:hypothetical protein AAFF_G00078760 [Aldrovandia affinis]
MKARQAPLRLSGFQLEAVAVASALSDLQGQEVLRAPPPLFLSDKCPVVCGVTPNFSSLIQAIIRLFPSIDPPPPQLTQPLLGRGEGDLQEDEVDEIQAKQARAESSAHKRTDVTSACVTHANRFTPC